MRARSAAPLNRFGGRSLAIATVAVCVAASCVWSVPSGAHAAAPPPAPGLVSAVPASDTPAVNDGIVYAIAQVGSQIILGGSFTSVSPPADPGTVYSLPNTFSFDAATGAIDHTGFLPSVNGKVATVIAGPRPHEVYIAGAFTSVDGSAMRVALLDTRNGKVVSSWRPATFNGTIAKLVLAHGRLYVGGDFTTVGKHFHQGLVALNPRTGKATSYVDLSFTGHHNYGRQCHPATETCANGAVGVKSLDVNPAGTRLVAVGDFTSVSGRHRDQIAMLNLGKSAAAVNKSWATQAYTAACDDDSFDSYIRNVAFSPTGGYFVVTATGGIGTNHDHTNSSCDAAARYETDGSGSNVRPTWIDYTGEDSLWAVAITSSAVYVGGHQRWLNNTLGNNVASPGSVPRPGIAALSPVNGLPFTWNPGRNPRGAGCFALLATRDGLWVGSDTNYIGNRAYLRPKIAFFPATGGESLPAEVTPRLPGRVYLAGATKASAPNPDRLAVREFNGSTAGREVSLSTGLAWGSVHGAFTVDGQVIYGGSDGNLYERSFDGSSFGPQVELDPYDDPAWDNVQTGSGQTYQGQPSTFLSEIPSVTSMFFSRGRLFYTMTGEARMHWRWFEPESGVVGSDEFTVPHGIPTAPIAGAFVAGRRLYYADQTNGELWSVHWSGRAATGKPKLVDASKDWASRGLFLLSNSTDPSPSPTAGFTAHCAGATCQFHAVPWVDPGGGVVRYQWRFGDGTTSPDRTAVAASHRFGTNGVHRVVLTVKDTAGAHASSTQSVTINAPVVTIKFVGAAKISGAGRSLRLRVPRAASARDALVLFDSYNSRSARATVPKRWHLIGQTHRHGLTTVVYDAVPSRHHVPVAVDLRYSRRVRASAVLAVYRHTAPTPIVRSAVAVGTTSRLAEAPTLHHLLAGSWVIGYWAETSGKVGSWRTPPGARKRAVVRGPVSTLVADSGGPHSGTYGLGSARPSRRRRPDARWALDLAPALR